MLYLSIIYRLQLPPNRTNRFRRDRLLCLFFFGLTFFVVSVLSLGCGSNSNSDEPRDTSMAFDTDSEDFSLDSNGPAPSEICQQMNCDDGNSCTEDTCKDARCYFTPTPACLTDASFTCTHWDDVCGEGCDWTTDYDCSQWSWQVPLELREPEEHDTIFYIDPGYAGTNGASDGSMERPFTAWSDIDFQTLASNTAVLQKRGTEVAVGWNGPVPTITFTADNVLIGAYGEPSLPRPKLLITGEVSGKGNNIIFRDLELERVLKDDGTGASRAYGTGASRALGVHGFQDVVYNVWIHGTSAQNTFKYSCIHAGGSRALKVLHSEISHCGEEVVMGGGHLLEVGYNKMEKIAYPDGGNGDGFQFGDDHCLGIWFHDNDFDGRFINAKFFVITTCGSSTILIEKNHIKMAQNRSATHVGGELVIMRSNLFEYIEDTPGATGLWLTGGNYEIYHNVFYNYAKAMNASGTRKVINNTFVGYTDVAMEHGSNSDVRNNIFAEAGSAWGPSGMTSNNNLFFAPSTVSKSANSGAAILGDPLLSNPGERDFSLLPQSPAINSADGTALDELTPLSIDGGIWRDFYGYPLDPGTLDIGALEHQPE